MVSLGATSQPRESASISEETTMAFGFKAGIARRLEWNDYGLKILLLAAALGLQGCPGNGGTANVITGMSFSGRSSRPSDCFGSEHRPPRNCPPEEIESLMFAEIGKQISVFPVGVGRCANVTVDFGDGTPPTTFTNQVLDNSSFQAPHTYTGWPGRKLVRVKGDVGCLGNVTKEITVGIGPDGRDDFNLALCYGPRCTPRLPTTSVCNVVTPTRPMPPIRTGSGVRIATNGHTIDYGSNQVFDASGDPSTPTPSGYLFPRRKKFSLVYRIGSKDFQGEAGPVTFVADQTAPLEICANDNPGYLADNTGEMLLTITVNEASVTVP
jgi:hypothetical protein